MQQPQLITLPHWEKARRLIRPYTPRLECEGSFRACRAAPLPWVQKTAVLLLELSRQDGRVTSHHKVTVEVYSRQINVRGTIAVEKVMLMLLLSQDAGLLCCGY